MTAPELTVAPRYTASYLARAGAIAWDRDALSSCVLDRELCSILHTVALLEEDTAVSARQARSLGFVRSADVSAFLPMWEREEAEHGRALRFLLERQSYAQPKPAPRRTSLRRRGIALVPVTACRRFPQTELVYCAMGAAAEYVTIVAYTELAKMTDEPRVVSLLRAITRQEGRHFSFFLSAARVRAAKLSKRNGLIARRVFDALWEPPGVPSIGLAAWRSVFARFLVNEHFRERVQVMDRVVDTIPHFDGMHLMRTFLLDDAAIRNV